MRGMLGDIGRRPAVFAAERQTLEHAQAHQNDGREHADAVVARQNADEKGRQAHDHDGDQEGVFAPHEIAERTEDEGAERADEEAGREGEERRQGLARHA